MTQNQSSSALVPRPNTSVNARYHEYSSTIQDHALDQNPKETHMTEARSLGLNYGHLGEPVYDSDNHRWHFARNPYISMWFC